MKKLLVVAGHLGVLSLVAGCIAPQTFTSARTLDRGKTEVTVSMALSQLEPEDYTPPIFVSPALRVRHGVSDRLELGAGLGGTGWGSVSAKVALLRPELPTIHSSLSIAPEVSLSAPVRRLSNGNRVVPVVWLPLLFGVPLGGKHELTLTAQLRSSVTELDLYAGGSAGLALRLSDGFVVTPEIGLMVPVRVGYHSESMYPTAGLGLSWGR